MWCSNSEHPELLHKAPVKPVTLTSAPVFVRPGAWAAVIKVMCLILQAIVLTEYCSFADGQGLVSSRENEMLCLHFEAG